MNFSQYVLPELEYGSLVYCHKENIAEFYTNKSSAIRRASELILNGFDVKVENIIGNKINEFSKNYFKNSSQFKQRLLNVLSIDSEMFFIEQNIKSDGSYDVNKYNDFQTRGLNIYDLSGKFLYYVRAKMNKNFELTLNIDGQEIKINYRDFCQSYVAW